MHVERYPVPTTTSVPDGTTNAYLVGKDEALLVDPAGRTDELDRAVAGRDVGAILVTHAHPDHVGGVEAYLDETDATLLASGIRADRLVDSCGIAPDRILGDGTVVDVDGETVEILSTPGHAPDHIAVETPAGTIAGDCVIAEGSIAVVAPEGDMRAYLTSLRRLHARNPPRLFPGHGPTIDEPRTVLERLVEHRQTRERRVLAAVQGGAHTLEAIVTNAYEKDLSGVEELARSTVVAHLEKLDAEGKLRWDGRRAQLR